MDTFKSHLIEYNCNKAQNLDPKNQKNSKTPTSCNLFCEQVVLIGLCKEWEEKLCSSSPFISPALSSPSTGLFKSRLWGNESFLMRSHALCSIPFHSFTVFSLFICSYLTSLLCSCYHSSSLLISSSSLPCSSIAFSLSALFSSWLFFVLLFYYCCVLLPREFLFMFLSFQTLPDFSLFSL